MPEDNEQLDQRRAYLLDVSLFLFDFLSPTKLIINSTGEDAILEVPSALVTMIWSSLSGSTILQDLIYAYLVGLRNNGTFSRNADQGISKYATATDQELRNLGQTVYDNMLTVYSQLIDGARRQEPQESHYFPIKRYEPILSEQTQDDLVRMRNAYMREFGIPSHPLYDLYFLQTYHAQSIGIAASPILKRTFVFFGRKAYNAISTWVGETGPDALNLETQERYKKSLEWFIEKYVPEQLVDKAVEGVLGLGISFVIAGVPQLSVIADVSVVSIATSVVKKGAIDPIRESPYLKQSDRGIFLAAIFIAFGVCVGVSIIWWQPWERLSNSSISQSQPNPASSATQTQLISLLVNSTSIPPTQFVNVFPTATSTPTLIPIMMNIVSPASFSSDVGYCRYVVQPGDTLQSVALRFKVTVNDLRAGDKLIAWGAFTPNQQIQINASCCSVINGQGYSYTVQGGETLFSIANRNGVAVETLASINNLYNPRYIQVGQMLCIPH